MFILTHPAYPRRVWESGFKRAYNIALVLNFACWITVFVDYVSRVNNTFRGYWSSSEFQYFGPLEDVLRNCTHVDTLVQDGFSASITMDEASAPFMILSLNAAIRSVFILHGVLIGLDAFAKALFAMNTRHFRIRGLHIPISELLVGGVVCLSVAIICVVATTSNQRAFMRRYIDSCIAQFKLLNGQDWGSQEHDVRTIFGTAIVANMWFVVANLIVYGFAAMHLCVHAFSEANAKILMLDYPWEIGVFCRPDKALLVQYTKERKEYERNILSVDVKQQLRERSAAASLEFNPTLQKLDGEEAVEVIAHVGVLPPFAANELNSSAPYGGPPVSQGQGQGPPPQEILVSEREDLEGIDDEEERERRRHRRRRRSHHHEEVTGEEMENDRGAAAVDVERRRRKKQRRSVAGMVATDSDGQGFEPQPGGGA